ncbi:uncharacterized protein LOC143038842 isoform X2 [Oratosquilla oratoria]
MQTEDHSYAVQCSSLQLSPSDSMRTPKPYMLNSQIQPPSHWLTDFIPLQDINHLCWNNVIEMVLALLNTGRRGVIYFGVNQNRQVIGVHGETAVVEELVERLLNSIYTFILPRSIKPCCGVRYQNVTKEDGQLMKNSWVVELHILPLKHTYYSTSKMTDFYIFDVDKGLQRHSFDAFCHTITSATMLKYSSTVAELEQVVMQLTKLLKDNVGEPGYGVHVCSECWFNDCAVSCHGINHVQDDE